jgi:hypothetical protein
MPKDGHVGIPTPPTSEKRPISTAVVKTKASKGELAFMAQLGDRSDWEREYAFAAPERKWRFDFANRRLKVAVEIEGGTWTVGNAHGRGKHFESDCEKYNTATAMGWRIYRGTTAQAESGWLYNWVKPWL